jgi:hypothetical protein
MPALPATLPLFLSDERTPLPSDDLPIGGWTPHPDTDEETLGQLPFIEAQRSLAGFPQSRPRFAECSWHGLRTDGLRGSFAVVRVGSPLADLVGSRLKITDRVTRRVVYVYCRAEVVDLPDDITLARRAFLALRPLWTETVRVSIEVV